MIVCRRCIFGRILENTRVLKDIFELWRELVGKKWFDYRYIEDGVFEIWVRKCGRKGWK